MPGSRIIATLLARAAGRADTPKARGRKAVEYEDASEGCQFVRTNFQVHPSGLRQVSSRHIDIPSTT
jgi:hypothetical protein